MSHPATKEHVVKFYLDQGKTRQQAEEHIKKKLVAARKAIADAEFQVEVAGDEKHLQDAKDGVSELEDDMRERRDEILAMYMSKGKTEAEATALAQDRLESAKSRVTDVETVVAAKKALLELQGDLKEHRDEILQMHMQSGKSKEEAEEVLKQKVERAHARVGDAVAVVEAKEQLRALLIDVSDPESKEVSLPASSFLRAHTHAMQDVIRRYMDEGTEQGYVTREEAIKLVDKKVARARKKVSDAEEVLEAKGALRGLTQDIRTTESREEVIGR